MSKNVLRYNSLKELQIALATLPDQLEEAALEAVNEAADFMVNIAKIHCLVDTGTLQGSIRKEQEGNVVSVKAGGRQFINPKTRRGCDYALHVERKNPFMRPAWETIKDLVESKIREKVTQKVNK